MVLKNPEYKATYKLSATSETARNQWMRALRHAARPAHLAAAAAASTAINAAAAAQVLAPLQPTGASPLSGPAGSASCGSPSGSTGGGGGGGGGGGSSGGSLGVPAHEWARIERAHGDFMRAASDSGPTWTSFGEKGGIKGSKRAETNVMVRGEGVVAAPLGSLFRLIFDPGSKHKYDAQLDQGKRIKVYNPQTVRGGRNKLWRRRRSRRLIDCGACGAAIAVGFFPLSRGALQEVIGHASILT